MGEWSDEVVTFTDVEVKAETAKALLCVIDGDEQWIPKSHIDPSSEIQSKDDSPGTLVITEWLAREKDLA